jgi:uncharacterized membrane protein
MTDLPGESVQPAADAAAAGGSGNEALFGISFSDVLRAQEFLIALTRMSAAHQLVLRDAVIVVKDDDGRVRVRETVDPQPGTTALNGALWTGLLGLFLGGPVGWLAGMGLGAGAGALVAKFVDVGIPDEWIEWFKAAVQEDTATVVALAADIDLPALYRETARFSGANLVHTTLNADASAHLAEALEISARRPIDEPQPLTDH